MEQLLVLHLSIESEATSQTLLPLLLQQMGMMNWGLAPSEQIRI